MSVLDSTAALLSAPSPVAPLVPLSDPDIPTVPIYRLRVDQYHAMIEAGILSGDDPVELLEGWLVLKMGKNPPHSRTRRRLNRLLEGLVPKGWYLDFENPVTTTDSEPEPDLMVLRGEEETFDLRHPVPEEIGLAIEISDTTLRSDQTVKLRLYARAGIVRYWIVNLVDNRIEVYTDPTGPADEPTYRQRQDFGPDAEVPVILDGTEVGRLAVRDLLP